MFFGPSSRLVRKSYPTDSRNTERALVTAQPREARDCGSTPPQYSGYNMNVERARYKVSVNSPPIGETESVRYKAEPEVPRLLVDMSRILVESSNDGAGRSVINRNHKNKGAARRQALRYPAQYRFEIRNMLQNVEGGYDIEPSPEREIAGSRDR